MQLIQPVVSTNSFVFAGYSVGCNFVYFLKLNIEFLTKTIKLCKYFSISTLFCYKNSAPISWFIKIYVSHLSFKNNCIMCYTHLLSYKTCFFKLYLNFWTNYKLYAVYPHCRCDKFKNRVNDDNSFHFKKFFKLMNS